MPRYSSDSNSSPRPSKSMNNMAEIAIAPSRPAPLGGISRLRERLSFKSTRSALAEKELLKQENRCTRPLTERNVDTFLIEQDQQDARIRRAADLHVSQWLQQLP